MSEKIKFSVIGFGHIGKRHAKMIAENPETELVSVVDPGEDKREDFRVLGYNASFYTDHKEFLAEDNKQTEVIVICTPNGLHVPIALDVLEKRYHVVIEKPMGLTKAGCEQVIFKSLQVSRHVFVVKQNRYSPPSRWLKKMMEEQKIGDVNMVQINCYWNRDDRYYNKDGWKGTLNLDGGTLFTQFSHFIDIMYWVFGDIKNVHAHFSNFNHSESTEFEDSGVVQFDFVNGGMGCINFSTACWDQNMESSITVIGSKGSLKIGGQYMNEIEYCHVDGYEMEELEEISPPNDYGPYKGSAANHHFVIQNVVDTLRDRSTITANALEGLKVVEIIERIYQSRNLANLNSTAVPRPKHYELT
ncbi:MAG: Gfo/Idh/MocA family oxidoreductase [Bacteroidia bacterium]